METRTQSESFLSDKKYNKLLNNLLNIKAKDQTIFTRVNSVDSFDLTTKFSKSFSSKVLKQKSFTLPINEVDLDDLIVLVTKAKSGGEVVNAFKKYKHKLFKNKMNLLLNEKTFENTKKELLNNLLDDKQKEKLRWKQFRRKVLDSNIQDNVWPLHIATFFISLATPFKTIYAPLLLKEVQINLKHDDNLELKTESDWKINEKLLFALEECGISISKEGFSKEDELEIWMAKILKQLNLQNLIFPKLEDEFINYKPEDIKNRIIEFKPGIVLGLFKPSGGYLRKTMQEIITNDEVDNILDSDPDKRIYKQNVNDFILNQSKKLIRIQKSNFSQDKALISSLIQDTIIWGPPGTGKSQVIANIIANILVQNKTAIVISQKKAALDVLKKRLGKISPFAFFILNDNKMIKSEFYKPLQNFVKMVEDGDDNFSRTPKEIISNAELKMLEIISSSKKNNSYYPSLQLLSELESINKHHLNNIFNLENDLTYPTRVINEKKYLKDFINTNNLEYDRIFKIFKRPSERVRNQALIAMDLITDGEINPNNYLKYLKKTDYQTTIDLLNCKNLKKEGYHYQSDENFAASFLSELVIKKINTWKEEYEKQQAPGFENYKQYKKFANAVRAGRILPTNFMNTHIKIIKELFNVIITNPETNFIDWKKNHFDYVVLDESSQIFLEVGLPMLYIAKRKILAGDTQQMQPTRWFTSRDDVDEFSEQDVPENAESLLDYAIDKGIYQIMLDQNYRSNSASLMAFSAKEFYDSKLEVIDKHDYYDSSSIEVVNVEGKWENSVNLIEINKVIEIVSENLDQFKTIIILAFNAPQKQLIERMILESHPLLSRAIEDERLSIKNIENIQGDEADLVVVSVVYDPNTNIGSTYVVRSGGRNALNVAVSRAKDKLIVVKSITAKNVRRTHSQDFYTFRNWLEFLDMSDDEQRIYSVSSNKVRTNCLIQQGNIFKREVIDFLLNNVKFKRKIKVVEHFEVGSYVIDIALLNEQNEFILGIETDSYDYHQYKGFDKYLQNHSRIEFLENKGYKMYRVTEIDFKLNKLKIIRDLNTLLTLK